MATRGTSKFLADNGIENTHVNKVSLGRPHVVDAIKNSEIQIVVNTASDSEPHADGYEIRRAALKYKVPYTTTVAGAMTMAMGAKAQKAKPLSVKTLQEYHGA